MQPRILAYIRRFSMMRPGDRVGVAVSGGADSVALLRLMLELRQELGIVLSVVHFNHKIRGDDADRDEQFVSDLAQSLGLQFHCSSGDAPAVARDQGLSLEAAARQLRYGFFESLLSGDILDRVATAHTLDDQAETVLLRLIRGAWTKGLASVHPVVAVCARGSQAAATIVRPLLEVRRFELEAYLACLGQNWRDDVTNLDPKHTRNRVRHELLPLLETSYNPAIRTVLAEMAEIARDEEFYWKHEAREWEGERSAQPPMRLAQAPPGMAEVDSFDFAALAALPTAILRRRIRAIFQSAGLHLDFQQVERVRRLMCEHPTFQAKVAEVAQGYEAVRIGHHIRILKPSGEGASEEQDPYELKLPVPGQMAVPQLGSEFHARFVALQADGTGYNTDQLLDPSLITQELTLRNWRPGDRYWPAHTKSPRKVKELLQERHIPAPERRFWPVLLSGESIVWLRGFSVPDQYQPREDASQALLIEEVTIENGAHQP